MQYRTYLTQFVKILFRIESEICYFLLKDSSAKKTLLSRNENFLFEIIKDEGIDLIIERIRLALYKKKMYSSKNNNMQKLLIHFQTH